MSEKKIEYILSTEETIAQNTLTGIISRALFMLDAQTVGDEGTNYKPLYYGLFNGITSIVRNTTTYGDTIAALNQLQSMAENAYIEQGD